MNRAFEVLKENGDPAPYFLSYRVTDLTSTSISASLGALQTSGSSRRRILDTSVRVGDYEFDNTRLTQGQGGSSTQLPIDDNPYAIKNLMWLQTDASYKSAVRQLRRAKQTRETTVAKEFTAADFSKEERHVSALRPKSIRVNTELWGKEASKVFVAF